ncbi:NAD(P)/FAD-dependent oxidoreductase [Rhizobium leguminosarum]|uniref:NAD(P)/FAD-dependent oxidoreductase n=1 Tax=Rhizobium leguminosarum TaxID=384 RepID=UPI001C945993|nr:FAD-dependent oxidoreductase [Rhizobium leguminosarum]MBY5406428.1 FAD-dependent oxidoreductase [Rhizobium leguminosarum]
MSGIVIIGAGEAGVSAAFTLRQNGFVGQIDLFGSEKHLPYERPPLSKFSIEGETAAHRPIRTLQDFQDHSIHLHFGRTISGIDRIRREVRTSDGDTFSYSKLLLATGAEPRRLPVSGNEHCIYLRTLDNARQLRQSIKEGTRIAIIGAGFIGLEVAATARQKGCEVSVFEGLPRILSRAVPEPIAAILHRRHVEAGVRILCNQQLTEITARGLSKTLHFADSSTFEADVVIAGIGSSPATGLAASADLTVDNGITVDAELKTDDPNIYAAGDCCSFPIAAYADRHVRLESWRAAQQQGCVAAANMLGGALRFEAIPWFWSDQYELTLQVAGLPAFGSQIARRDGAQGEFLFHLDENHRIIAVSALGEGNSLAKDVRISEMLIAARKAIEPAVLQSSELKLKSLLAS